MSPAVHGDGSTQAVINGRAARARRMAPRDAWLQELREHRVTHRQSRFRWWAKASWRSPPGPRGGASTSPSSST